MTTRDHRKKVSKFFRHFGREAKTRSIEPDDFEKFYGLWSRSRYELYVAKWMEVRMMSIFAAHVFDVANTLIARSFRSDERILAQRVSESVRVYSSETVAGIIGQFHEQYQRRVESFAERQGGGLSAEFLSPWNFIQAPMLSDRKEVIDTVDGSEEIEELVRKILRSWDRIIDKITLGNWKRVTGEIATMKLEKGETKQDEAFRQAVAAAAKHPELTAFRLNFSLSYDSSAPKETLGVWARIIAGSLKSDLYPRKVKPDFWRYLKDSEMKTSVDIETGEQSGIN